jgi:3-phosphoshikimate 1-carboxyvinyltransferase
MTADAEARQWPDLIVDGGRDVAAAAPVLSVAGDKSITHRALISALMTDSSLDIGNANLGGAVLHLLPALRALGFDVRQDGATLSVRRNLAAHVEPCPRLDVRESSAAARLLIGVLAGRGINAAVDGDSVLRRRPMDWVVAPLRALGARIDYLGRPGFLPLVVREPVTRSARVTLTVGSAQARSAVLIASATAGLPVHIGRAVRSRDHTERMLTAMGADLVADEDSVSYGGAPLRPLAAIDVPGDPSLAAYPAALELLSPSPSGVRIQNVCLNPTRTGFFDVLRRAGARISYTDLRESAGERVGTVVVRGGLSGVRPPVVSDRFTLHSLIDEVPLLAAVASRIDGVTLIGCAEELSFKETNRLTSTTIMLRRFGIPITETSSSLRVVGGGPVRGGATTSFGDHRLAMTAATFAATLACRTLVESGTCHRTSFPGFVTVMTTLGLNIRAADGTLNAPGQ